MRKYNINANLVRTKEHLLDNAIRAVQMNCSMVLEQQLELDKDAFSPLSSIIFSEVLCLMAWKNIKRR